MRVFSKKDAITKFKFTDTEWTDLIRTIKGYRKYPLFKPLLKQTMGTGHSVTLTLSDMYALYAVKKMSFTRFPRAELIEAIQNCPEDLNTLHIHGEIVTITINMKKIKDSVNQLLLS